MPKATNGADRGYCMRSLLHTGRCGSNACYKCGVIFTKDSVSPSTIRWRYGICRPCGIEIKSNNRRINWKRCGAQRAKQTLVKFLRLLGLPENYNPRKIISNPKISNKRLKELAKGGGYPDWRKEFLEEKRRGDFLKVIQWARAILDYRAGQRYRIAWRFNSTSRKIFKNVFAFYEWQLKQGE